jgi:hypothetical protein
VLTILVAGTLAFRKKAAPDVFHVYDISERDAITRTRQMDAVEAYVRQSHAKGSYKLHFARARDVQAPVRTLLTFLGGSSHLDAEGPLFITLDLQTT